MPALRGPGRRCGCRRRGRRGSGQVRLMVCCGLSRCQRRRGSGSCRGILVRDVTGSASRRPGGAPLIPAKFPPIPGRSPRSPADPRPIPGRSPADPRPIPGRIPPGSRTGDGARAGRWSVSGFPNGRSLSAPAVGPATASTGAGIAVLTARLPVDSRGLSSAKDSEIAADGSSGSSIRSGRPSSVDRRRPDPARAVPPERLRRSIGTATGPDTGAVAPSRCRPTSRARATSEHRSNG